MDYLLQKDTTETHAQNQSRRGGFGARDDTDADSATATKRSSKSRTRIDELTADGDHDGADTWRRIAIAVEELANTTPPGPLH